MTSSSSRDFWIGRMVIMGLAMVCLSGQLPGSVLVSAGNTPLRQRFASALSGKFSNQEQVTNIINTGLNPGKVVAITYRLVEIPKLTPNLAFYFERTVDGQSPYILIKIPDGKNGQIVMKSYLLKENPPSSSSSTDLSRYQSLTPDDVEYVSDFDETFYEIAEGKFLGMLWPDCQFYPPEQMSIISGFISCDEIAYLPMNDTDPRPPSVFKAVERFPLISGIQNVCMKQEPQEPEA